MKRLKTPKTYEHQENDLEGHYKKPSSYILPSLQTNQWSSNPKLDSDPPICLSSLRTRFRPFNSVFSQ